MSHDGAGHKGSTRCPKCGERNLAADVRCWACDARLHLAPDPPAETRGRGRQELAGGEVMRKPALG